MENNFNFMIFSFFEIDSLTAMKEAVREVFIQDFKKGKLILSRLLLLYQNS